MARLNINDGFASQAGKRKAGSGASAKKKDEVSIWQREIELTPAFGGKEKQQFFHMLAVLLGSGLSITEGMDVVLSQTKKRKSKQIIGDIRQQLNEGVTLSEAVSSHKKYFSQFEIHSIRMGERAGQMIRVLKDLAAFHEKRIKLRKKLQQAFTYPVVVILIAGGVLFFMINFVVPMFKDIFARFNAELPGITQAVMDLSDFSAKWGFWIFLVLLGIIVTLYQLRNTLTFRKYSSAIVLRLPIFGKIQKNVQISRFCYTLALMLRSKVNLDHALELMEQIITFYPLQSTIGKVRKDVVEGRSLREAFAQHPIYPEMLLQMVQVGEKTARLDDMLENLARNLEEESEGQIGALTSLLEPLLIVVLGLLVGIILVSMYLPMFELSNTISA